MGQNERIKPRDRLFMNCPEEKKKKKKNQIQKYDDH